ncbi:MAG: hypothetical protein ACLP52_27835 [Streptosporangiaceae bacterium]
MSLRKVSYLIPVCNGCGLAWSFGDPCCADGIPPHFASRAAALDQLAGEYGWVVRPRRFARPVMTCRRCSAAGVTTTPWQRRLAVLAALIRDIRRPGHQMEALPAGHPESVTAMLPPAEEELLAAIEAENFPSPEQQ